MPTDREREYYDSGYVQGYADGRKDGKEAERDIGRTGLATDYFTPKTKRKMSPWNKFVKANSKKPRFIYKSGSNKGKLNLKKMGVAFRKTPAGKKKK